VQSRNFPKRLARRHDGALFQCFAVKDRDGSRKAAQPVVTAGHLAGRDNDVLRQVADAQLKPDAGLAAAERHALHGGSESVADGAHLVIAGLQVADRKRAFRIRTGASLDAGGQAADDDRRLRQHGPRLIDDLT
jgi:hypothetical protein